jgi:hypothetical protein
MTLINDHIMITVSHYAKKKKKKKKKKKTTQNIALDLIRLLLKQVGMIFLPFLLAMIMEVGISK